MSGEERQAPTAPQIGPEERAAALEAAMEARRARAALLERARSGEIGFGELLEAADADRRIAGRIRVRQALMALPGVGAGRADRAMREAGVAENRRLGGLGPRQREKLSRILGSRGADDGR